MIFNPIGVCTRAKSSLEYNYGNIASDPRLAAMNFIHALATIEPTLEKFRKKNEELEKD